MATLIARETAELSRDVCETCPLRLPRPVEGPAFTVLWAIKESGGKNPFPTEQPSFQSREGGA